MEQKTVNQREWQQEDNWLTPKFLGIYAGVNDSRLFVPKRNPGMGWTINFGHKYGPPLVFGLAALAVLVAAAGWHFAQTRRETVSS